MLKGRRGAPHTPEKPSEREMQRAIRAALDLGRLCELRVNFPRPTGARPGPQVRRITLNRPDARNAMSDDMNQPRCWSEPS